MTVDWLFLSPETEFEIKSLPSRNCRVARTGTLGFLSQSKSFIVWHAHFFSLSSLFFSGAVYFGRNYHKSAHRSRPGLSLLLICRRDRWAELFAYNHFNWYDNECGGSDASKKSLRRRMAIWIVLNKQYIIPGTARARESSACTPQSATPGRI